MKKRKFYIVYLIPGLLQDPGHITLEIDTREHGKTSRLLSEIDREIRRQKRMDNRHDILLLNLLELDA